MAKKSNTLVPMTGTVVIRDGKRIRPTIGKAFEYEGDEIEQLKAAGAKFRAPTDETEIDEGTAAATGKRPSAELSQAKARGGKKAATAAKSDEEVEEEKSESKDDDL